MAKEKSNDLKALGNENSYTPEFFAELCEKINLTDRNKKSALKLYIKLAAQKYTNLYGEYLRQIAKHEAKKELKNALKHIEKATDSLFRIYASGHYGSDIISNIDDLIALDISCVHKTPKEMQREDDPFCIISPVISLNYIASLEEALELTIKNFPSQKTAPKSIALYSWIMVLSAELEPIIGRKLEQSRYHKTDKGGEYISKKEMNDSELLLFIISPLDPNVTISQIETALKDTRKERHEAPWDNYF